MSLQQAIMRAKLAPRMPINYLVQAPSKEELSAMVERGRIAIARYDRAIAHIPRGTWRAMYIIYAVAKDYNVSAADIVSARRFAPLAKPRHVAMHIARTMITRSLPLIGRLMGGRDHTTVLHGHRRIAQLAQETPELAEHIAIIIQKVKAIERGLSNG